MFKQLTADFGFAGVITAMIALTLMPMSAAQAGGGLTPAQASQWVVADAEMYATGIDGYSVSFLSSSATSVTVHGDTKLEAEILVEDTNNGGTVTVTMADSSGQIVVDFRNDASGSVYEKGVEVASWAWDAVKGEYSFSGFDQLTNELAWGVLINVLGDDGLRAAMATAPPTAPAPRPGFGWLPALPIVITFGYMTWCIGQCQCCENFYLGNPAPGTPEPTCCANCFSWRCFDFS